MLYCLNWQTQATRRSVPVIISNEGRQLFPPYLSRVLWGNYLLSKCGSSAVAVMLKAEYNYIVMKT